MNGKMKKLLDITIHTLNVNGKLPIRSRRNQRHKIFQEALTRAYGAWALNNWEWVDSFFDDQFLTQRAAPLWHKHAEKSTLPHPVELANLWAEQLHWADPAMKQRHMVQLLPAINQFLRYLCVALRTQVEEREGRWPKKITSFLQ